MAFREAAREVAGNRRVARDDVVYALLYAARHGSMSLMKQIGYGYGVVDQMARLAERPVQIRARLVITVAHLRIIGEHEKGRSAALKAIGRFGEAEAHRRLLLLRSGLEDRIVDYSDRWRLERLQRHGFSEWEIE